MEFIGSNNSEPLFNPIAICVSSGFVLNPSSSSIILNISFAISAEIASGFSATYASTLPVCNATLIVGKSGIGVKWFTSGICSTRGSYMVFNWATTLAPVKSESVLASLYLESLLVTKTISVS